MVDNFSLRSVGLTPRLITARLDQLNGLYLVLLFYQVDYSFEKLQPKSCTPLLACFDLVVFTKDKNCFEDDY